MDGWWDVEDWPEFFSRALRTIEPITLFTSAMILDIIQSKVKNLQSSKRAFEVGKHHYDAGNDLFEMMLGDTMAYSCGYWKVAHDLDSAQINKFDLICRKIGLKKGDRILDIGMGWGGFARWAATQQGAQVVGCTVSKEQATYNSMKNEGLPIDTRLVDWRVMSGEKFDHIVSVGMFEHVGAKKLPNIFQVY